MSESSLLSLFWEDFELVEYHERDDGALLLWLGAHGGHIDAVAMDMNSAFDLEVREHCPGGEVVYDLFHVVAKYGRDALAAFAKHRTATIQRYMRFSLARDRAQTSRSRRGDRGSTCQRRLRLPIDRRALLVCTSPRSDGSCVPRSRVIADPDHRSPELRSGVHGR